MAKNCATGNPPNVATFSNNESPQLLPSATPPSNPVNITDKNNSLNNPQEFQIPFIPLHPSSAERLPPPSSSPSNLSSARRYELPKSNDSSSEYDSSDSIQLDKPTIINKTKKQKTHDKVLSEVCVIISRTVKQKTDYPLNSLQFKDFFTKSFCNRYLAELALEYTKDLVGLAKMLKNLYPLHSSSLKNRNTMIMNVLEEFLNTESEIKSQSMDTNTTG